MSVTVIGIVIIVFALISCLMAPSRLLQAIVFFASFSGTAVINFNNYGMSPAVVLVAAYLLWKLWSGDLMQPVEIDRNFPLVVLPFVAFATLSVVSLLLNAGLHVVSLFQVTQTAYVMFGVFVTLILTIEFAHPDRFDAAIQAMKAGATFISLWGFMQVVCFYTHIPYPDLFNNSNSHFAYMFNEHTVNVIRIASVAVEPSVLAVSLMIFGSFGATILTIEPRFRTVGWVIPVGLSLLVLVASTSTTAYFGIAVLAMLLGMRRPGLTLMICGIAVLAAVAILITLPVVQQALYQFTFGKEDTVSYLDRVQTVRDAVTAIEQRPWLGWGWGSHPSLSIITQLLVSVGSVGTACFLLAIVATIVASRSVRRSRINEWKVCAYAAGMQNAMIVYMAQSVVTGFHFVVADFWCLWAMAIAVPSVAGSECMPCVGRIAQSVHLMSRTRDGYTDARQALSSPFIASAERMSLDGS